MPIQNFPAKFHRWTAIAAAERPKWVECVCECGTKRPVELYALKSGQSKSCGCLQRDLAASMKKTHGLATGNAYHCWHSMHQRCSDRTHKAYYAYGGRGIKVCDRWKSVEAFCNDMGPRPEGTTLDRINVDGDYTPENCRWATVEQQQYNKRNTAYLEIGGVRKLKKEWCAEAGISHSLLNFRLKKGLSPREALTLPVTSDRRAYDKRCSEIG